MGERGHHYKNGEGVGEPIQRIVGVAAMNLPWQQYQRGWELNRGLNKPNPIEI